jgi:hypothetical protein
MSHWYALIYFNPQALFVLRLAEKYQQEVEDCVICQNNRKFNPDFPIVKDEFGMLAVAKHNCRRDKKQLLKSLAISTETAKDVANFEIHDEPSAQIKVSDFIPSMETNYETLNRPKRSSESETSDPIKKSHPIESLVKIFVDQIKPNPSKDFDTETLMGLVQIIYNRINPKVNFPTWVSQVLGRLTEQNLEQHYFSDEPVTSPKKFKSLVRTLTSPDQAKRDSRNNQYVKQYLFPKAKQILLKQLVQFLQLKSNNYVTQKIVKSIPKWSNFFKFYGGPMAPTFPIYAQFNMTDHHSMHKRALPLIPILGALAVGAAGANKGSSVVNGRAPLSWFCKPQGAMFGFADAADVQRIVTQLTTVSTALTSLQVDSMETRQAINDMAIAQRVFNQKILKAFHATTAVMLEIDLKYFICYLITVIDSYSHKITTIGLAGSTGRARSLALTSTKLSIVADRQLKTKNIKLSTDLEQVKMSMLKLNKKIMMIFNIPILVEENLYHFYKVDAIPLFGNNTMYIPEIDAPFIGISRSGNDYVTVTAEEYTRCTTGPSLCTVSSPSYPMTSEAHCSVTTYVTGNMTCALIESYKPPIRYVHVSGNHTIFSVPAETLVYIKCDDPRSTHKSLETTLMLKNMGQVTFCPGCTVNFPDGTKFLTPAMYPTEKIKDSKLFQLLTVYSIPKGARIRRFYNPPDENLSHLLDHKDLDVSFRMPTIAKFKHELLHPKKTLVFIIKAALFAVCIVAALSLCCCYWPPIRMCLGNSRHPISS